MRLLLLGAVLLSAAASAQTLQSAFPALPAFDAPVDLQAPDDGSNRLFVVEQTGRIEVFEHAADVASSTLFLNISSLITTTGSETGLLGMAFDPDYAQNGHFYVNYTAPSPLRTVIARFTVSADDPNVADPTSRVVLLTVDQPYNNHNAGQLAFGPPEGPGGERYLYVGLGDGGLFNDPQNNGENPATLLGSMLRLDVNGGGLPLDCGAGTGAATVPPSNPFVGQAGFCDEIYAYGLRNPYRYSFDGQDRFWIADVGQNEWEEVDIVQAGDNLGWDPYEGNECFEGPCDPTGLTFPIHVYPHTFNTAGGFAIIGGYVYDGPSCAALRDLYVYGDNVTGNVWTIDYDGVTADNQLLIGLSGRFISSFGVSEQGDLFLTDLGTGRVFGFDCAQAVAIEAAPVGGPLVVGPGGGTVAFDVTLTNTTGQTQSLSAWADADLSNGDEIAAVIGPRALSLPPGGSVTRRVQVQVPAATPAGVSTLTVKGGDFPDGPISSARITVTKESVAGRLAAADGAWAAAWLDAPEAVAPRAAAAATPALHVGPNPVTDRATVRVTLEAPTPLRVEVLDVLGRRVALLADGPAEAGVHAVTWAAEAAPPGVYLVRMTAGDTVRTQRVTHAR
ncbi:MAG: PQQ-dependent sugar dehydrogenase [Rubricoccaceae bacterium]|nr:PQQ-dependent sugar dehydrogenase [Rubricoccaceae bacterium]